MSQFVSGFWDLYIAVLSVVSIIACAVFLKAQSVRKSAAAGKEAETSGHTWDEDLTEYNNPLPRWWAWLFYLTIAFGLVYLALYPGLGSYSGTLGWTQLKQLEDENRVADARFGPLYEKFAAEDIPALSKSTVAVTIGQKLFLNNCAQCHASDGGGGRGFPNLADNDWLYGGTPEAIKASITNGRNGVMPPLGAAAGGDEGAKDIAHYVLSLSKRTYDSLRAFRGKERFSTLCAACHGSDGKGNQAIGAPNLTDEIWLYGSSETSIIETIMKGRGTNMVADGASVMPAHKGILSSAKIHLLTAYVYGLSRQRAGGK